MTRVICVCGARPNFMKIAPVTDVISKAALVEQPRGNELEYRVIGLNKAGNAVNVTIL